MINQIIFISWLGNCNDNIVIAHPRLGKGTMILPQSVLPLQTLIVIINKNITITIITKTIMITTCGPRKKTTYRGSEEPVSRMSEVGEAPPPTSSPSSTRSTSSQQEYNHQHHLQGKRGARPKDTRGGGGPASRRGRGEGGTVGAGLGDNIVTMRW